MDVRELDEFNKAYLIGLERSAQFSYTTQYFWWKKYAVLSKLIKQIIYSNFSKQNTIKIIDFGCQIGHDIFKLSDELNDYNIIWYGVDIGLDFLKLAKTRARLHNHHNFNFLNCSIESPCFKNEKFDIIITTEVVEHIINTETSVKCLREILKVNGYLIVSTPNIENRAFKLARAILNFFPRQKQRFYKDTALEFAFKEKENYEHKEVEHINLKKIDEWRQIFKTAGFYEIRLARGALFYGSRFLDNRPVIAVLTLLFDRFLDLSNFFISWAYNFFIVLQKK